MSDYLSQLVARSLNQTEVIKPRLASLFEPLPPSGLAFEGQSGLEKLNGAKMSYETDAVDPLPPQQSMHSFTEKLQSQLPADSLVSLDSPHKPLSGLNEKPIFRSTRLIEQATPPKPVTLGSTESKSQPPSGQSQNGLTQSFPLQASVPPRVAKQPSIEKIPYQSNQGLSTKSLATGDENYEVRSQSTTERSRRSTPEPAIQPMAIGQAASLELTRKQVALHSESSPFQTTPPSKREIVVHPQMRWHLKPASSLAEPIKQEPTVIQVTIGRVEVRAIMQQVPTPQQKSKQSTPRLSLEDYLRSRNRGRS